MTNKDSLRKTEKSELDILNNRTGRKPAPESATKSVWKLADNEPEPDASIFKDAFEHPELHPRDTVERAISAAELDKF